MRLQSEQVVEIGDVESIENGTSLSINSVNGYSYFLNGNVGIGTTTPSKELTVNGEISASGEIKTDSNLLVLGDSTLYETVGSETYLSGFTGHG